MAADFELNAVLAHAMLGNIAGIKGAVHTVLAHDLQGDVRDELLTMALRRIEFLSDQIRDLALGLPGEALYALHELRVD